jgi:hypothetical protein
MVEEEVVMVAGEKVVMAAEDMVGEDMVAEKEVVMENDNLLNKYKRSR